MKTTHRHLCLLLLSFVVARPLAASSTIHATPLGPAALRDLAQLDLPPQPPRVRRHRWLPPLQPVAASGTTTTPPITSLERPSIPAPTAALAFTSGTSRTLYPADAAGAVGPNHVIGAYNNGIVIHDRNGALVTALTLRQFWATSAYVGDQYDPRIAYDAAHDRWILVSVDREEALLIAVSATGDPTGTWRRHAVRFGDAAVDFTRLGLTRDTVLVATCTGNYEYNEATEVLSIRKADLYGDVQPLPMIARSFDTPAIVPVDGPSSVTEYVVTQDARGILVTPLSQYQSGWRIVDAPDWLYPADLLLPQLGWSPLVQIDQEQLEHAVLRNGSIYTVASAGVAGNVSTAIAWCRFDPETLAAEWGSVSDPNGTTWYAYPSLAVNANGAMLIGFGTFSDSRYPSAAYVYRDAFGRVSTAGTIRDGDAPVTDTDRWGDYTTTLSDPARPTSFWTVQICSNGGYWGTVWARVDQPGTSRRRAVRH